MLAPADKPLQPLPFRGGEEPRSGGGIGAVGSHNRPYPKPSPDGEGLRSARLLALLTPAALLAGAWGFQLIAGLPPCEMCHWQRWGHYAALALAALSFAVPRSRVPLLLAALGILASGAVGAFHAGVEQGWWEGITRCTAPATGSFADLLSAPIVRCDAIPWSFAGVSIAGWNAILSLSAGVALLWLTLRPR